MLDVTAPSTGWPIPDGDDPSSRASGMMPCMAAQTGPVFGTAPDLRAGALLIAADARQDSALAAMADSAGFRQMATLSPAAAPDHLARVATCGLLLVDMRGWPADQPAQSQAERVLVATATTGTMLNCAIVCICSTDSLDHAAARLWAADAQLLCDPQPHDVVAALAHAALKSGRMSATLHDSDTESEQHRLDQISDEVRRLAASIEALTRVAHPAAGLNGANSIALRGSDTLFDRTSMDVRDRDDAYRARPAPATRPQVTSQDVRALLRLRRQRDRMFPAGLFADPAWDMLLDLMAARLAGEQVSVSSLCIAAAVPPTTALRWIRQLSDHGLIMREEDPRDGRRVFVRLSDDGADRMQSWLADARGALSTPAEPPT